MLENESASNLFNALLTRLSILGGDDAERLAFDELLRTRWATLEGYHRPFVCDLSANPMTVDRVLEETEKLLGAELNQSTRKYLSTPRTQAALNTVGNRAGPKPFINNVLYGALPKLKAKVEECQNKIKWQTATGAFAPGTGFISTDLGARKRALLAKIQGVKKIFPAFNKDLMPPVWRRTAQGWLKDDVLTAIDDEKEGLSAKIRQSSHWKTISQSAAEGMTTETPFALYYVIVDDETMDGHEIQGYVGLASNGVNDRWTVGGACHTSQIKNALKLEQSAQLVDIALAYAWKCGRDCALFCFESCGNQVIMQGREDHFRQLPALSLVGLDGYNGV